MANNAWKAKMHHRAKFRQNRLFTDKGLTKYVYSKKNLTESQRAMHHKAVLQAAETGTYEKNVKNYHEQNSEKFKVIEEDDANKKCRSLT